MTTFSWISSTWYESTSPSALVQLVNKLLVDPWLATVRPVTWAGTAKKIVIMLLRRNKIKQNKIPPNNPSLVTQRKCIKTTFQFAARLNRTKNNLTVDCFLSDGMWSMGNYLRHRKVFQALAQLFSVRPKWFKISEREEMAFYKYHLNKSHQFRKSLVFLITI